MGSGPAGRRDGRAAAGDATLLPPACPPPDVQPAFPPKLLHHPRSGAFERARRDNRAVSCHVRKHRGTNMEARALVDGLRRRADGQPGLTPEQRQATREMADKLEKTMHLPGVQPRAGGPLPPRATPPPPRRGPWKQAVPPWAWAAVGAVAGVAATLAWTGRWDVRPAGPQGVMAWMHDRWTGTVQLCPPRAVECIPIHPPRPRAVPPQPNDWITPREPGG